MAKFSKTVSAGSRIYYFDVRTDSKGNDYVSVTELNKRNKKRSCIYIHPEDFDNVKEALTETIKIVHESGVLEGGTGGKSATPAREGLSLNGNLDKNKSRRR